MSLVTRDGLLKFDETFEIEMGRLAERKASLTGVLLVTQYLGTLIEFYQPVLEEPVSVHIQDEEIYSFMQSVWIRKTPRNADAPNIEL